MEKVAIGSKQESGEFVVSTGNEIFDLILQKTSHMVEGQRWLIVGRIVSYTFWRHFKVTYDATNRFIESEETKHSGAEP